jgi:opacity protein-like surface antigen
VKRICGYLPLLSLLLLCVPFARAQTSVDFMLGFGTAHDSSNGQGIESAASANAFGTCNPSAPTDQFCLANPKLSGFFLGIGGDVMLWRHLGIGAEVNVQPARSNYGSPCNVTTDLECLQFRQEFYDFNAIYAPVSTKRVSLKLEGGIGGAHTGFAINESGSCVGTAVCTSAQAEPVGSSNHFQVHVGVGVEIFVTEHVFVRPEFDFHYAPGLTDQFGSNSVPAGMVWVGYSFGEH